MIITKNLIISKLLWYYELYEIKECIYRITKYSNQTRLNAIAELDECLNIAFYELIEFTDKHKENLKKNIADENFIRWLREERKAKKENNENNG